MLACAAGIGVAAPALDAADAARVTQLSTNGGGTLCHPADKKLIGPSNRDITAKYKGRADAVALLTRSVRGGSTGVWGTVPMPPTPPAKSSDADLRTLLGAILNWPHTPPSRRAPARSPARRRRCPAPTRSTRRRRTPRTASRPPATAAWAWTR